MDHKTYAVNIGKQAGKIILENFHLGMKKEWKKDGSPLTDADLKINKLVVESINEHFPDHGIIAEEGGNTNEAAEYIWLVDPIDGTVPFSHGISTSVFSIALVRDGQPILGVVLDPFLDRLYSAEKGKGAYLNDKPIHVSENKKLTKSLIGTVDWKAATYDISMLPVRLVKKGAMVVNIISTVHMGMLVASGELVGSAWGGFTPFDVASVKIIVEEAGGKVTDLDGNDQRYDQDVKGGVASNGILHKEIIDLIK